MTLGTTSGIVLPWCRASHRRSAMLRQRNQTRTTGKHLQRQRCLPSDFGRL